MPKDRGVLSTRIHKTNLRRFVKDDKISPRLRLAAELLLARLEGTFPVELIDTILNSEFGSPTRLKKDETVEIVDAVEKRAADQLKSQWQTLSEENVNKFSSTATTPRTEGSAVTNSDTADR